MLSKPHQASLCRFELERITLLALLSAVPGCSLSGAGGPGEIGAVLPAPAGMVASTTGATGGKTVPDGGHAPGSPATHASAPASPAATLIDQTGADNPAGLTPAEVTKLMAGGPPAEMKWLYPYDGTVFPGGTISPLAMWTGNPAPDAVYLHMKSRSFEYKGILKPATEGSLFVPGGGQIASVLATNSTDLAREAGKQLAIPQNAWDEAGRQAQGRDDLLLLEVSERVGDRIFGPVRAHVTIARGALQGSIYYNTCSTGTTASSSTPVAGVGSLVMRIPAGGNAQPISDSTQCVGCHSISANGSRLVAQRAAGLQDLNAAITTEPPVWAWSAPFSDDGTLNAKASTHFGSIGAFGALYPDGSKYLAPFGAAGIPVYPASLTPLMAAVLYDATTGAISADTGIPTGTSMPTFSPDGTRLVFNDMLSAGGRTLEVMDYDTQHHKASGRKLLVQDASNAELKPGWPFFLPDNRAVIFVQTTSPDFASGSSSEFPLVNMQANAPQTSGSRANATSPSDLHIVDLATGTVTILAKAMGFHTPEDAEQGNTYLPFNLQDLHSNYFPTVSPVASGGYFWVFFDSFRHFGSLGTSRAVWGAAIDIHPDGSYATDPSHPAFYVPGQEFISASHHRAFATLDQCKSDHAKCASGIECCSGSCDQGECSTPPPNKCADRDEHCGSGADCCDSSLYCINNFCAFVELL